MATRQLKGKRLRWGWTKQEHVFQTHARAATVIHNVRQRFTGRTKDYKFKNQRIFG